MRCRYTASTPEYAYMEQQAQRIVAAVRAGHNPKQPHTVSVQTKLEQEWVCSRIERLLNNPR